MNVFESEMQVNDTREILKEAFSETWDRLPEWMKDSYTSAYDWLKTLSVEVGPPLKVLSEEKQADSDLIQVDVEVTDASLRDLANLDKFSFTIKTQAVMLKSDESDKPYGERSFKKDLDKETQSKFKRFLAINGYTFGIDRNPPIEHFDMNPELDNETIPIVMEADLSEKDTKVPDIFPIGCARIKPHVENNSIQILRVGMHPDLRTNGVGGIMMDKLVEAIYSNPREYLGDRYNEEESPIVYLNSRYGDKYEDRTDWYRRKGYIIPGDVLPIENHGVWNVSMYYLGNEKISEDPSIIEAYNNYHIHMKEMLKQYTDEVSRIKKENGSIESSEVCSRLKSDMSDAWDKVKDNFEIDRKAFIDKSFNTSI